MKLKLKIKKPTQKAPVDVEIKPSQILSSKSVNPLTEETKSIQQAVKQQVESQYNADSIKILNSDEAKRKFEWLQVGKLAAKFSMPEEFIERGLECCRRIGVNPEFFVNRYLKREGTPFNSEFEAVYKEILNEYRMNLWTVK